MNFNNLVFAKENGGHQNFVEELVGGTARIMNANLGERFDKKKRILWKQLAYWD